MSNPTNHALREQIEGFLTETRVQSRQLVEWQKVGRIESTRVGTRRLPRRWIRRGGGDVCPPGAPLCCRRAAHFAYY